MSESKSPARGPEHEALDVFYGKWRVEGSSYATGQVAKDPKANAEPWVSDEISEWIPGKFFLIQRWTAKVGEAPFQGLGVMAWDADAKSYVTRAFDNLGVFNEYATKVDGNVWTLTGKTARARIEFTDPDTQVITWEWKPGRSWLPLCDRTAHRVGRATVAPEARHAAPAEEAGDGAPDSDSAPASPKPRARRPARRRAS